MDAMRRLKVSSTRTVVAVVGSRLKEAQEHLVGLLEAEDAVLTTHELLVLQNVRAQLEEQVQYVDAIFKAKESALRRSK